MLTLKAAGLLDVDTGRIVSPGVLTIDGEYIAGVGDTRSGRSDGEVIDLRELILLPGLMDMEVHRRRNRHHPDLRDA